MVRLYELYAVVFKLKYIPKHFDIDTTNDVLENAPRRWWVAYNPPIGSIYHLYTTYILPSRGLYNPYHPLQEPEKSTEMPLLSNMAISIYVKFQGGIPPLYGWYPMFRSPLVAITLLKESQAGSKKTTVVRLEKIATFLEG